MTDRLVNVFGPLDGMEVPGGCEYCDAYQRFTVLGGGVYRVDILHDDWCPELARIEGRR